MIAATPSFPFPKLYQHLNLESRGTAMFVHEVFNNNEYLARAPGSSNRHSKRVVLESDQVVIHMDDDTSSKVDQFLKIALHHGLERFIARPLEFTPGRLVLERTFGSLLDYLWYFKIYHNDGFARFFKTTVERLKKWINKLEMESVRYKFSDGNLLNLHIQFPLDMPLDLDHIMNPDNLCFVFIDLDSWNQNTARFPRYDEMIGPNLNRSEICIGSTCSSMLLFWHGLARQTRWDFVTESQLKFNPRMKTKRPFMFDTTDDQQHSTRRKRVKINVY